jgi:hypothetical protein
VTFQKLSHGFENMPGAGIIEIDSESPVKCPQCSRVFLDVETNRVSPCEHVLFIYANSEAFEYIDPPLEERLLAAQEIAEQQHGYFDTWDFLKEEAGADVILEHVEEAMACGPIDFTVWVGIVAGPHA